LNVESLAVPAFAGVNALAMSRDRKQFARAEAEQQIAVLHELAKTRYIRTYYLAAIYATLGDKDKAFAELEKSFSATGRGNSAF